jgi:hypothetical protein
VSDLVGNGGSMRKIPEDLKQQCPNCNGTGRTTSQSFVSDADGTHPVISRCSACRAKGWMWALDQQEMAERIADLSAANARLKQPVTDEEWEPFWDKQRTGKLGRRDFDALLQRRVQL